jgi:hypothetical protein
VIQPVTMIPPSRMASGLIGLFQNGKVYPPLAKTMGNVATAFVLSVGVGFLMGLLIHAFPRVRRALAPFLASYYAVPFFVFYPLLIVIFGMNDLPIVVIGFLFGVVAMLLNTLNGLDRVARVLLKTGRVLRMGRVRTALQIRLPAAACDEDRIMELALEAGADDVKRADDQWEIVCDPAAMTGVLDALKAAALEPASNELVRIPTNTVDVEDVETARKVLNLMERLDDHDDVQSVAANFSIPDAALAELA